MKNILRLASLLVLCACAAAWPARSNQKAKAITIVPDSNATAKTHIISTEMSGVDSLGIMPTEMVTPTEGGFRSVPIEASVFHRETPVTYEALGRRDPFRPLLTDDKGKGDIDTDLLVIDGAVLKGVVWSEGQYLAIIRDKSGKTFFLREGDPIYQGHVLMVTQSQTVFEIADFGEYDQVTLKVKV
jgi:hypothetical protein